MCFGASGWVTQSKEKIVTLHLEDARLLFNLPKIQTKTIECSSSTDRHISRNGQGHE